MYIEWYLQHTRTQSYEPITTVFSIYRITHKLRHTVEQIDYTQSQRCIVQ